MKTKLTLFATIFVFLLSGCDKEEAIEKSNIDVSSISFTGCNTAMKSAGNNSLSVRLVGQADGTLKVKMTNTEFCCGTDSVSVEKLMDEDRQSIEVIDNGPLSYCFCSHDLEFILTSLENSKYDLTLIESENSYSRDTFHISFVYSAQLDTTIFSASNY